MSNHTRLLLNEVVARWSELPLVDVDASKGNILDHLTSSDPSVTDYVLEVAARCLQCGAEIRTLSAFNQRPCK